jgi:membrane-bound ClpP family serine protease
VHANKMSPLTLVILFFAAGVILLIAEVFLPTHGMLGLMGAAGLVAGVVVCFRINQYLGLASAVGLVCLMPFAAALWVKVWPHTYAGKRLILAPPAAGNAHAPAPAAETMRVGQVGVVVSELRPGGLCEFGGARVEARCERGTIPAGQRVEVVALVDSRPLVRAV